MKGTVSRRLRGAALMEAALTLPILFIIFLGVINGGRMMAIRVSLTNAAREGVRYGASRPSDRSGIAQRVFDELVGSNIAVRGSTFGTPTQSGNTFTVAVTSPAAQDQYVHLVNIPTYVVVVLPGGATEGQQIVVRIVYAYEHIGGRLIGLNNTSLQVQSEMRILPGAT